MKNTTLLFLLIATLLTSCSKITILRTEELLAVQNHVDSVTVALLEAQKLILEEQNKSFKTFKVNQEMQMAAVNDKLDKVLSNLNESQARISDLDQKTGVITTHWKEKARKDSLSKVEAENSRISLFNEAKTAFSGARYKQSLEKFSKYIEMYPESEEFSQAKYWSAEIYFALMNYTDAEKFYREYIKSFPNGEYRANSFYKLGLVFGKIGKDGHRDKIWKSVIKNWPDSKEAMLIKQAQSK